MPTHPEAHSAKSNAKLNSLRAAVLGADDGIVSVSGIVIGVASASASSALILTSGIAGLAAGALSMAAGEYVSVSSQRDTERALLTKERAELKNYPEQELKELENLYIAKGLKPVTARAVAKELTTKDVFAAHVDAELNINPDDLTNPWHAAIASALSFLVGAMIPLLTIVLAPEKIRILVTFVAVIFALIITGMLSAHVGGANKTRATIRVVAGGVLAMAVTYGIGKIVGTQL